MDIKIASGLFRGLSALHNTTTAGPLIEKDRATTKPNARRMANGWEGASEMAWTLARDGSFVMWRAQKLEWVCGEINVRGERFCPYETCL